MRFLDGRDALAGTTERDVVERERAQRVPLDLTIATGAGERQCLFAHASRLVPTVEEHEELAVAGKDAGSSWTRIARQPYRFVVRTQRADGVGRKPALATEAFVPQCGPDGIACLVELGDRRLTQRGAPPGLTIERGDLRRPVEQGREIDAGDRFRIVDARPQIERGLEMSERIAEGIRVDGGQRRADGCLQRAFVVPRRGPVVGELGPVRGCVGACADRACCDGLGE